MPHTTLNPTGLHNPTPFGYSHTARIPAGASWVVVAGQYGSGEDGRVVSPHFADQVQRAFHNLSVALAAHGLAMRNVVQLRTYVVNPDFEKLGLMGQTVGKAVAASGGSAPPPQTVIGVASLAMPDILFEVEAVAVAAG
jgi:enamine deaminase RidA (YjgF/YER057c/UK114 family)